MRSSCCVPAGQAELLKQEAELKQVQKTPSKSNVSTSRSVSSKTGTAEHDSAGADRYVPSPGDEENDSNWEVVDDIQEKVKDLKDEIKDTCIEAIRGRTPSCRRALQAVVKAVPRTATPRSRIS